MQSLVCLPDLFALWVLCMHSEQHGSFGDVFIYGHIQDVHAELWSLVYIDDRHREKGGGLAAILETFHQRLWVTSINLEPVTGRGLKVQRLLGRRRKKVLEEPQKKREAEMMMKVYNRVLKSTKIQMSYMDMQV